MPETFFVPTDRNQNVRISDDLPLGSRGGVALRYYFPADGEYLFEMRPKESGAGGGFEGITGEPHQLDIAIDNVKVGTTTLGGPDFAPRRGAGAGAAGDYPREDRTKKILELMTFRVPVKAGSHMVQAYFASKTTALVEDLIDPSLRREPYRDGSGEPRISSLTITGPQPTTASVGDTASRRHILTCAPSSAKDETCARKIVSTLARRAYRRPITEDDLQAPLTAYRGAAANNGFEPGIEMAIRSILMSPKFLFRFESQPPKAAANTAYRVSDLDLASRLSFFLWSSIPDDELVALAEKKTLSKPEVLQQQVKRMLADPRSQAMVDNFAGQWLHIRNVAVHQPSPETLFHFDDNLRKAFEQETKLFFESIMRENRSVLELVDADYTFLNERLARHYGIDGVQGERFRRVTLPRGQPPRRTARAGVDSDGDLLSKPDVGRDSRQVDSRERIRRAAAAPSAERAGAERRARSAEGASDARTDGGTPRQSCVRRLPRTDGPARFCARKLRCHWRVARHLRVGREGRCVGPAARRVEVQRTGGAPENPDVALGRVPDDHDRKADGLCAWPRAGGE